MAGTYDITFSRSTLTYTFTVVTASIDGDSFSEFKVYPNPSSNLWVFENATQSIKSITLYDTVGKVVSQIQPNSLTGAIDAKLLTGGLYLAQVSLLDGSQTTVKLFKK